LLRGSIPQTACGSLAKYYLEHILAPWSDAHTVQSNKFRSASEEIMSSTRILYPPASHPTRRQMIAGVTVALGSLGLVSPKAFTQSAQEISHSEDAIHQEPVFKASRKRVYDALTDAKQFQKVTLLSAAVQSGMAKGNVPAEIAPEPGGPFKFFNGFIVGRNLELVPNERIVQAWRVAYWPQGAWSLARFVLVEQGTDTKVVFDHTGFPKGDADHLLEGWNGNYWQPLAKFLST
jgi:activator of HSP90 ATPase